MQIRLVCHSFMPGAEGNIGDVLNVADDVGAKIVEIGGAVSLETAAESAPVDLVAVASAEAAVEPQAESAPAEPAPTGNPKRARG